MYTSIQNHKAEYISVEKQYNNRINESSSAYMKKYIQLRLGLISYKKSIPMQQTIIRHQISTLIFAVVKRASAKACCLQTMAIAEKTGLKLLSA